MTGDVLAFLGGHPGRIALFEAVEEAVTALGESTLEVKKSQVSWKNPRLFAMVSLPPMAGRRKAGDLMLTLGLGERLDSPRVFQAVEPYPGRWTHHILLPRPEEVDGDVRDWLAQAYRFAREKGRRHRTGLSPDRGAPSGRLPAGDWLPARGRSPSGGKDHFFFCGKRNGPSPQRKRGAAKTAASGFRMTGRTPSGRYGLPLWNREKSAALSTRRLRVPLSGPGWSGASLRRRWSGRVVWGAMTRHATTALCRESGTSRRPQDRTTVCPCSPMAWP